VVLPTGGRRSRRHPDRSAGGVLSPYIGLFEGARQSCHGYLSLPSDICAAALAQAMAADSQVQTPSLALSSPTSSYGGLQACVCFGRDPCIFSLLPAPESGGVPRPLGAAQGYSPDYLAAKSCFVVCELVNRLPAGTPPLRLLGAPFLAVRARAGADSNRDSRFSSTLSGRRTHARARS
jgi:hypothetical protein